MALAEGVGLGTLNLHSIGHIWMVPANITTKPKGNAHNISALIEKSVDTPRIMCTQWLLV